MSDINKQIDELEAERLSAYEENQRVKGEIRELQKKSNELYKKEFELHDKITELKTGSTSTLLGKFAKINDRYIHITSVCNTYNSSLAGVSGPSFYSYKTFKSGYKFVAGANHESATRNPDIFIGKLEDIQIITKEEFYEAFEKYIIDMREKMHKAIEMKPIKTKDSEYLYEEEMYDSIEE